MKLTLITLTAFTLSIAALHAADTITVISPSLVQRNGVNVGNVASFVATNPQFAAEVQAGLEKWAADLQTAAASAVQAASTKQTAAEEKLKTLVTGAKEALSKRTSVERVAAASAMLAEIEKTDKAKRLEAIAAEKAKLDTEAAELAK